MEPDVPDHNGYERLPGDRFFAPPDPRIGELWSATTGQNADDPRGPPQDVSSALLIAAACLIIGSTLAAAAMGVPVGRVSETPPGAWALGAALAAIVTLATRPVRRCTYVGALGVSQSTRILGLVSRPSRVFLFADAARLDAKFTRVFRRGAYHGTAFRWRWSSADGRPVFTIEGAFPEYDIRTEVPVVPNKLRRDHPIYFARAAETAWNARSCD